MQEKMNEEYQRQQQAHSSQSDQHTSQVHQQKKPAGDYIDFEEVK